MADKALFLKYEYLSILQVQLPICSMELIPCVYLYLRISIGIQLKVWNDFREKIYINIKILALFFVSQYKGF